MPPQNLRAVGDRIEQLLDELHATADPRARATAEELLRLVTELYGGALERVVELAREDRAGIRGPALRRRARRQPADGARAASRSRRRRGSSSALESVRPFLAEHGGDVELLDIDATPARCTCACSAAGDGCPSSA